MTPPGADGIAFNDFAATDPADLIALTNLPAVRRYMPLAVGDFDAAGCRRMFEAKAAMWRDFGFGPRAIEIDGRFAGWGGLQPEPGEAGIGLVLHPKYWGRGRGVLDAVLARGWREHGFASVIALLPPTRPNARALLRLGFVTGGEMTVGSPRFARFRLYREAWESRRDGR